MPDRSTSEVRFINPPELEKPPGYSRVVLRDMGKLPDNRRARDRFLRRVEPHAAPAITLLEVSRLFAEGLLIGIEGIAAA